MSEYPKFSATEIHWYAALSASKGILVYDGGESFRIELVDYSQSFNTPPHNVVQADRNTPITAEEFNKAFDRVTEKLKMNKPKGAKK